MRFANLTIGAPHDYPKPTPGADSTLVSIAFA